LDSHSATDVFGRIGDEFRNKNVVVGCVAYGAADDANGEGEGGNGTDEVVRADDSSDDGGRDDDAADTKTCENKEAPEFVEVVNFSVGDGTASWMTFRDGNEWVEKRGFGDLPAVIRTLLTISSSLL
jgi:hypothetical protein